VKNLSRLEDLAEKKHIDLFYGDESGVSLLPCIPYGWQFLDEDVFSPGSSGQGVNCFALLSRQNECWYRVTRANVSALLVAQWLESFAQSLRRLTVVVLDNAIIHRSKEIRRCLPRWENRGLYLFYLPTYSPHLNIAEILWRKLKYEWLRGEDYADRDRLHCRIWQALAEVGETLHIHFNKGSAHNKFSLNER
jgi:transposase